jgi:hypothetical protein
MAILSAQYARPDQKTIRITEEYEGDLFVSTDPNNPLYQELAQWVEDGGNISPYSEPLFPPDNLNDQERFELVTSLTTRKVNTLLRSDTILFDSQLSDSSLANLYALTQDELYAKLILTVGYASNFWVTEILFSYTNLNNLGYTVYAELGLKPDIELFNSSNLLQLRNLTGSPITVKMQRIN